MSFTNWAAISLQVQKTGRVFCAARVFSPPTIKIGRHGTGGAKGRIIPLSGFRRPCPPCRERRLDRLRRKGSEATPAARNQADEQCETHPALPARASDSSGSGRRLP